MIRVLIVDDNKDASDSLGQLLRLMGHEVEVAYSANSAISRVERFSPDLFLLDLALPDIDGYELARRLRQKARKEAKFVAVTGYGPGVGGDLAETIFDDHVLKPISPEILLKVLALTEAPPPPPPPIDPASKHTTR